MAKPLVLLLDDDEAIRLALPLELRSYFEVISVETKEEAVNRIKTEQGTVDVALVDMKLGEDWEGGLKAIQAILALDASPEIIVLTAYGEVRNAAKCMEAGAFSYVEKSGRVSTGSMSELLIPTIRRALQTRTLKQQVKEEIKQRVTSLAMCLAAVIDSHEPYSIRHSRRVAECARIIAQAYGLDEQKCENVFLAGHIHDLGMLGIDINVLTRPGPLTPVERAMIHAHPLEAERILKSTGLKDLIPAILDHHEQYGGGGYPNRKTGDAISVEGQILGLADTLDAMVSPRPYRKEEMSLDEALYTLTTPHAQRHLLGQFSRAVIEAFQKGFDRIRVIYDPYAFGQEGQRKQLTIFATDIVNSSRLATEIGDLRFKHIIDDDYVKRLEALVKAHEGLILKYMGDGFLVVFYEAKHAADCAMRLQQSLIDNPILDGRLEVRIGVHTAEVFAQQMSYGKDILGEGVNLVARLESQATPGEVLISDETYRELPEIIATRFERTEPFTPKGFPEPISPWSYRVHKRQDTSHALA